MVGMTDSGRWTLRTQALAEFRAREIARKHDIAKTWILHTLPHAELLATTNEVLTAYLTAKGTSDTRGVIENWVRPAFGLLSPIEVTCREIEAWVLAMRSAYQEEHRRPLPAKTERTRYSAIAAAFAWAKRVGLISQNNAVLPRGVLQPNRVRSNFNPSSELLTLSEFRGILVSSRIPLERRLDYALAGVAGLRNSERYDLRISDIDLHRMPNPSIVVDSGWSRKEARSKPTKSKIAREVPAHNGCVAPLLRAWIRRGWFETFRRMPQPDDLLLPRLHRGELVHRNDRQALKRWHKDLKAHGLGKRRLHSLRHFFCTSLARAGVDIKSIEWLTHPSPRWHSAEIYVHSSHEWLCSLVQKLDIVIPEPFT